MVIKEMNKKKKGGETKMWEIVFFLPPGEGGPGWVY